MTDNTGGMQGGCNFLYTIFLLAIFRQYFYVVYPNCTYVAMVLGTYFFVQKICMLLYSLVE